MQAKAANTDSSVAKTRARGKAIVEDLLSAAHASGGSLSLSSAPAHAAPATSATAGGPSEEEQLQMALAASRAAAGGGDGCSTSGGGAGPGAALTDEQQLELAIKASLGDWESRGGGGGDAGASTSSGRVARSVQTMSRGAVRCPAQKFTCFLLFFVVCIKVERHRLALGFAEVTAAVWPTWLGCCLAARTRRLLLACCVRTMHVSHRPWRMM